MGFGDAVAATILMVAEKALADQTVPEVMFHGTVTSILCCEDFATTDAIPDPCAGTIAVMRGGN
jgi:hypothetical protein